MIPAACIVAVAVILAAIILANTIENVAHDFFKRWDEMDC